jgi:hypothetical protein
MDRAEITVRKMLTAIEAPFYDVGVLSHRGMLPGLDSIPAKEVQMRLSLLKYRNARGSHNFAREITRLYAERESERERKRLQAALSPYSGRRSSALSLERFRTSSKYQDRPASADIAFCVAALGNGMSQDQVERALEDDYLSRDPSPSKRAAYIRRTIEKARRWIER